MLASYYVIPFFLAAQLPTPPYSKSLNPEYTFEARLTTTTNLNGQVRNGVYLDSYFFKTHDPMKSVMNRHVMKIELKCRSYAQNALLCYKGKHEQYPPEAQNLVNISDWYQETLFQIRFNKSGVIDYAIERTNKNLEFLLNLYRFFGSQLSIGTVVDFKRESSFQSMEHSVIGSCPTYFDIRHHKYIMNRTHTLRETMSLSTYVFKKDETIRILKRRSMGSCHTTSNYMFGSSFWSELLPNGTKENIISSQSIMMLSESSFESKSQNIFNLYDQNMKAIGGATESIEVVLKSILLPKDFPSRIFLRPIMADVIARSYK